MSLDWLSQFRSKLKTKKRFEQRLGYKLNLQNPQTYCEKIQWLKYNHNSNDEKVIARSDKFAVRSFVISMGYENLLVKLYGVWDGPEQIDWDCLPEQFVFKLNHGSGPGSRWFVKDRDTFSMQCFEIEVKKRLGKKCGRKRGEFHYDKIHPKIIAEEYLTDKSGPIKDYKFYCFHGVVHFFSVEEGKVEGLPVRDYYDRNWNRSRVKFRDDLASPEQLFCRPERFNEMILIAEHLSQGYPHLRVDLYNVEGRIFFGELTYTPENGMTRWDPLSLDLEYGQLIDIHKINH